MGDPLTTVVPRRTAEDLGPPLPAAAVSLPAELATRVRRHLGKVGWATVALFALAALLERLLGLQPQSGRWGAVVLLAGAATAAVTAILAQSPAVGEAMLRRAAVVFVLAGGTVVALAGTWVHLAVLGQLPYSTWLAVVVVLFPLLVPMPATRAAAVALALVASAPVSLALVGAHARVHAGAGLGVALQPSDYARVTVTPALAAILAVFVAHVVFGMGVAIARARREIARQQQLGSYRLERPLGKGGMGEVWLASHGMLARPAAIKLIRPAAMDRARGIAPDRADAMLKRFEREAQVTATLSSHHTVQIYDFGRTLDGSFYYVMELLEGLDLETLVRRHGPMPAERVAFLLLQVCHSLADAHSRGLIHRDVKPANIYVCNKGLDFDFVKVLDFGLVALQSELASDDARITAEGAVAGTPAYMAPELAVEGADVDARADVYAVGCVAYWMLAGRLVFEGESAMGVIVAHASKAPSPPSQVSEVEIPPALEALVLACLEKSPDHRPASAAALALALERTGLPQRWNEERARAWWVVNSPSAVGPVSGASLVGAS